MESVWIPVFRTGTWTDSSGNTREWTEGDLDAVVGKFPGAGVAPVVIGHPRDNSPAYGWVEEVKRDGGVLLARIKPTVEEFVEWVKKKIYNKISISLYGDKTLRHIGFLGGAAPAVKGLEMPEFADGEDWTEWGFGEVCKEGVTFLDAPSNPLVSPFSKGGGRTKNSKEGIDMTEQEMRERIDELERRNREVHQNFQEAEEGRKRAEEQLKKLSLNMRKMEYERFLNEEIAFGAMTEEQQGKALEILQALESLEFAEGEEPKNEKKSLVSQFQDFLASLPAKTVNGEIATKRRAAGSGDVAERREQKVQEWLEKYPEMNLRDAYLAVERSNPELFQDV